MKKISIDFEEYPDYPIVSMAPISRKICNLFFMLDIKILDQARNITREKFLKMRGMGPITWKQLQEYIEECDSIHPEDLEWED